jgi:hypothetical protein
LARPVSLSRDFLDRATASPRNRKSTFADGVSRRASISLDEKEIRNEFGRIADVTGLTNVERAALFGEARELSRVILALETVGAALDLFHEPYAAVAWLRGENADEPFHHRSPLQLMAVDGQPRRRNHSALSAGATASCAVPRLKGRSGHDRAASGRRGRPWRQPGESEEMGGVIKLAWIITFAIAALDAN